MRRLTLILSDLYLHDEANVGSSQVMELTALEWLLRMSDKPRHIADWRQWLLAQVRGQAAELPLVTHCAYGLVPGPELETVWFATPVHLEARLDHVRLSDRGLLHLDGPERAAACEEFSRSLGAPLALHDGGERTLFLTGLAPAAVRTHDPARFLGADIGPAVPAREAGELRRLSAELEMWLHGADFNRARERANKPRVSTFWLWRGFDPEPHGPGRPHGIDAVFLGNDPLMGALSRLSGSRASGAPAAFENLDPHPHIVVAFAPVTGRPHETLLSLDTNWFAPAKAALIDGSLSEIELVANDRVFRIGRSARWRFWRPRARWVDSLAQRSAA